MNVSELLGKTLVSIEAEKDGHICKFETSENDVYVMEHFQDCYESVFIEDIFGDTDDLLNTPILKASEDTNHDDLKDSEMKIHLDDSFTWTFYNLATIKGSVTIRWFGTSNGYYSEAVTFYKK